MNCPNCGQNDWKLAKVVYSQGVTDINTSTSGSALGAGVGTGGFGVGYAGIDSETTGEHRTAFSKLAAPPNVPSKPELLHSTKAVGFIQYLALGYGVYLAFAANILVGFIVLVLLFVYWNKFTSWLKSNREGEHQDAEATYATKLKEYEVALANYKEWEKARICQRCGTFF